MSLEGYSYIDSDVISSVVNAHNKIPKDKEYNIKVPAKKALYLASPDKRRINIVVFLTCEGKNPDGKAYLVPLRKTP